MFRKGIAKSAIRALAALRRSSILSEFYLAGGTAAALQLGHRLSIDLDFFSINSFEAEVLRSRLEDSGIKLLEIETASKTLHCSIEQTKVSFFHYPYPLIDKQKSFEDVSIAALLDIALMKITAIASRGSKKDFIDLFFLLQNLTLAKVFGEFGNKFPVAKLDPYHYIKSLTYFDDADKDPMPRMLVPCKWEEVKQEIEREVSRLVL